MRPGVNWISLTSRMTNKYANSSSKTGHTLKNRFTVSPESGNRRTRRQYAYAEKYRKTVFHIGNMHMYKSILQIFIKCVRELSLT